MSELIQKNDNRATIRWKLLTGVSALALTAYVSSNGVALAEDSSQPQVWIELGGQLSQLQEGQETFTPTFEAMRPSIFSPSSKVEKPPLHSIDEFAQISFRPEDSNWVFAASIRYGRALKDRHRHQQTYPSTLAFHKYPTLTTPPYASRLGHAKPIAARFADTLARNSEQHTVLDFQADKDVGLGLFGKDSTSIVSLGVRFAQFREKSNIALRSDPDWHFQGKYYFSLQTIIQPFHSNAATFEAQRSFRGVGPSLSWAGSTPFAGNSPDGELTFDWGVNAAVLFGRQKTKTQHHTTVRYNSGGLGYGLGSFGTLVTKTHIAPPAKSRSRNVTVPNVGGFAGISFRYNDAKVSFGYRADVFFNAIDGGIDTRKNENRGFNGPYASISFGLGD